MRRLALAWALASPFPVVRWEEGPFSIRGRFYQVRIDLQVVPPAWEELQSKESSSLGATSAESGI